MFLLAVLAVGLQRSGDVVLAVNHLRGQGLPSRGEREDLGTVLRTDDRERLDAALEVELRALADLAVEFDIIHKSGSWFSYNDAKLAQGRDAVRQLLIDNKELCDEIEGKIREALAQIQD